MAGAVNIQVDQNFSGTWLWYIKLFDLCGNGAGLIVNGSLVLLGDLDVTHCEVHSFLSAFRVLL